MGINHGTDGGTSPQHLEWGNLLQIVPRFSKLPLRIHAISGENCNFFYAGSLGGASMGPSPSQTSSPRWTHSSRPTKPSRSASAFPRIPASLWQQCHSSASDEYHPSKQHLFKTVQTAPAAYSRRCRSVIRTLQIIITLTITFRRKSATKQKHSSKPHRLIMAQIFIELSYEVCVVFCAVLYHVITFWLNKFN